MITGNLSFVENMRSISKFPSSHNTSKNSVWPSLTQPALAHCGTKVGLWIDANPGLIGSIPTRIGLLSSLSKYRYCTPKPQQLTRFVHPHFDTQRVYLFRNVDLRVAFHPSLASCLKLVGVRLSASPHFILSCSPMNRTHLASYESIDRKSSDGTWQPFQTW